MTLEEIRVCVRKTIDDCLVQVLQDRPAIQLSQYQESQLGTLVEELSQLFLAVRLGRH